MPNSIFSLPPESSHPLAQRPVHQGPRPIRSSSEQEACFFHLDHTPSNYLFLHLRLSNKMARMTDQNFASPLSPRRRRSIWTRLTRSIHGSLDWNSAPPLTVGLRERFAEVMGRGEETHEEGQGRREGGREDRRTYVPPRVEEEEEERLKPEFDA